MMDGYDTMEAKINQAMKSKISVQHIICITLVVYSMIDIAL